MIFPPGEEPLNPTTRPNPSRSQSPGQESVHSLQAQASDCLFFLVLGDPKGPLFIP